MNFDQKVWNLCKKVPKGRITTYKEIAKALNCKAYRAVGNALNKNPTPIIVPCHRVVKSNGEIGGFSKGIKEKARFLKNEGTKIKNNYVKEFSKKLYRF